ncbi:hypothetical protein HanRHA438_Chr10g0476141 [Helianthus annuus]|nr:hypothetical protein HanRHA438_Chr10g0476141 [Helianthus annuus]
MTRAIANAINNYVFDTQNIYKNAKNFEQMFMSKTDPIHFDTYTNLFILTRTHFTPSIFPQLHNMYLTKETYHSTPAFNKAFCNSEDTHR